MSMLPPVGWADVATRRDLDVLQTAIQQDMKLLRAELRQEMAQLRGDLHEALASHTRTLFLGLGGMMFTLATLTWAAISLT